MNTVSTTYNLPLLNGRRLTVVGVTTLNDVDLDLFVGRRLVVVGDRETVGDDCGLVHHCLHLKLGDGGLLALVDADDEVGLTDELLLGSVAAGRWAADGHDVTLVVVAPVPVLQVASCSAIAAGLRSPAAVELVYGVASEVADADAEIFASVFAEKLKVRDEEREARRRETRA